ncbi:hypothetical protein GCM10009733_061530 [Nonomuraea maheshkhaliensis]|uniref:Lipoprotein n=1 Tax=Nonomuraea maheshkhaliensis TaxID=419590 RepID=A0ABN2FQN6_9ACTN
MRRLRGHPRTFGTAVLALLIPLAACSPPDGRVSAPAPPVEQSSGVADDGVDYLRAVGRDPRIVVRSSTIDFLVAEKGEVRYNAENRCLELMTTRSTLVGLVWPKGTGPARVDGKRGVTVPGLGDVLEGTSVALGGGYEKWGKKMPYGYRVDGDIDCLSHAPNGDVFVIATVDVDGVQRFFEVAGAPGSRGRSLGGCAAHLFFQSRENGLCHRSDPGAVPGQFSGEVLGGAADPDGLARELVAGRVECRLQSVHVRPGLGDEVL